MTTRARKKYEAELDAHVARTREEIAALADQGMRERMEIEERIRAKRRDLGLTHAREFFKLRARWGFQLGPGALAILGGSHHGRA